MLEVFNNTINGLTSSTPGTVSAVNVVWNTVVVDKFIYKNTISNLSGTANVTAISVFYGDTTGIYSNKISNISTSGENASVIGIQHGPGNVNLSYNNVISELYAPVSANPNAVLAIAFTNPGKMGLYYNTVYLDGTSSSPGFGSSVVRQTSTSFLDMRNNIFVNASIPTSPGKAAVFTRLYDDNSLYLPVSNNNMLYAGSPTPSNLLYGGVDVNISTLDEYKLFMGPDRETNSFSELPPFVNVSVQPYDLNLRTNVPTFAESRGTPVAEIPAVDFYGNPRDPVHPDLGSQEGAFVLPVILQRFEVQANGGTALLSWSTASESNSDYFEVQAASSADAGKFVTIQRIPAAGNSSVVKHYSYAHAAACEQHVVRYRLRQVDRDGKSDYSDVRLFTGDCGGNIVLQDLSVRPNPVSSAGIEVQFSYDRQEDVSLTISDVMGKTVESRSLRTVPGLNRFAYPKAASLPAGTYVLTISGSGRTISKQFIR